MSILSKVKTAAKYVGYAVVAGAVGYAAYKGYGILTAKDIEEVVSDTAEETVAEEAAETVAETATSFVVALFK